MQPHTIRSFFTRRRTRWFLNATTIIAVLALTVGSVIPAGATGNGAPPLPGGSTFEAGDGDLGVNTAGNHDWNGPTIQPINCGTTVPTVGTNCSTDLSKIVNGNASSSDNAFGQGTKEDNAAVTVVDGSIPPNKSDLIRFYVNSEFANGNNFLYLAWERSNVLGTANMDFEINQVTTPGLGSPGPHTINRTAGDLLVTYDFSQGGTVPTVGLLFWVTSGPTSQCFSSNSLPCWGNAATNINSSDSQGAINLNNETDTNPPPPFGSLANPTTMPAFTFGEVGLNLTALGVFPSGTCRAFGSAFLKSRASTAFGSEVKDFVTPVPVNISNCGEVVIIKHTDPRGLNQSFSYTSNLSGGQLTCTQSTPTSFSLNDNGNSTSDNAANTQDCKFVPAGSYNVTEGTEPANFTLESLTCSVQGSGGSTGVQDGTDPFKADITLAPNDIVTCTYVNQGSGAILVTKTAKNLNLGPGQHPLAGATFTVNGVSHTTDANGHACFDGLKIGQTYTVTETSAPNGYAIDTASKNVTVTGAASCTSGTPDGVSFTDSPLTDVAISATSEVPGATNSTITCVDANGNPIGNSPQGPTDPATVTANGLQPGTYTCTVVVDP